MSDNPNNPMTPQRLLEIREREQKATQGPWTMEDWSEDDGPNRSVLTAWEPTDNHIWLGRYAGTAQEGKAPIWIADCADSQPENTSFLAHARQDIPDLCAALTDVVEAVRLKSRFLCLICVRPIRPLFKREPGWTDLTIYGHAPGCPMEPWLKLEEEPTNG